MKMRKNGLSIILEVYKGGIMAEIITIFFSMMLIFISIALVFYVIFSIGLYTLAKNNGHEDKAFFAWIPVLNTYLIALLAGDINIFGKIYLEAHISGILAIILTFSGTIIANIGSYINSGMLFLLTFTIYICSFILMIYIYYNLLKNIDSNNATLLTIVSFLVPIVFPIYIFVKRNTIFEDKYEYYFEDENIHENTTINNSNNDTVDSIKYDDDYNEIK